MSYAVVADSAVDTLLRRVMPPYMALIGNRVLTTATILCPVGKTGELRASLYLTLQEPFGFKVGSTLDYAIYVHEGTRPHIIRPVRGRFLRFEGAGGVVFAREVHHPGTRAQPFLRDAMVQVIGSL